MSKPQLLAEVHERITDFERDGDSDLILGASARAAVDGLDEFRSDLKVCHALGLLFWYRYAERAKRGDYEADAELDIALEYLLPVYQQDFDSVPEDCRPLMDDAGVMPGRSWRTPPEVIRVFDDTNPGIDAMREALDQVSPDHPAAAELAYLVGIKFIRSHAPDQAIFFLRKAIWAESPMLRRAESFLGVALVLRFEHVGDRVDLDEAVPLLRAAVRELPPNARTFELKCGSLVDALHQVYLLDGDLAALTEAIAAHRQLVRSNPTPDRLATLAIMLRSRCVDTRAEDSRAEALSVAREAVSRAPSAKSRYVLGGTLVISFRCTGDTSELDEAITLLRAAVNGTEAIDFGNPVGDLASALVERARINDDVQPLDEAISLLRGQPGYLGNLAAALEHRYLLDPRPEVLDEAVDTGRRALNSATSQASKATRLMGLAGLLYQRYQAVSDRDDQVAAIEAVRELALSRQFPAVRRQEAAMRWGRWAAEAENWDEAVDGHRHAVELLSDVLPSYLGRSDQQKRLADAGTLVADAVALALDAGSVEGAFELLEQGRGLLVSDALGGDDGLDWLRTTHPALAQEHLRLRTALSNVENGPVVDLDRMYRLGEQWDRNIAEIRQLDKNFLRPPRLGELRRAGVGRTIVTLNVSKYRSDALVLDNGGVRPIRLHDLRHDELSQRVGEFAAALPVASNGSSLVARMSAQDSVRQTLEWLWDKVTWPVFDAIGAVPRVWWSPHGLLKLLPLHAAGYHSVPGRSVLDRVVSSYTPTVRALLRSPKPPTTRPQVLVVSMPTTPGHPDLPATTAEAATITTALPPLIGDSATRSNVLDVLKQYEWVHFACHAHNDPGNPSGSHLVLHDQPLLVTDIDRLSLDTAELAYLSACSTALTSAEYSSETVHLGSAFQLAGFRHVIATFWRVDDKPAAEMAAQFYKNSHMEPAFALHEAVRQVRDQYPMLPTRWAGYQHTGD